MNDQELRALVREAVARHLGRSSPSSARASMAAPMPAAPVLGGTAASPWAGHASHGLYVSLVNVTDACVIEPSVPCDHCGYCKSHGH